MLRWKANPGQRDHRSCLAESGIVVCMPVVRYGIIYRLSAYAWGARLKASMCETLAWSMALPAIDFPYTAVCHAERANKHVVHRVLRWAQSGIVGTTHASGIRDADTVYTGDLAECWHSAFGRTFFVVPPLPPQ